MSPERNIFTLTPDDMRQRFPQGIVCGRCKRVLRALDTAVYYPCAPESVPWVHGIALMIICEPCLDHEIQTSGWTPPEGV